MGKSTFSMTVMLSKSAEPWKSIPISRLRRSRSGLAIPTISRPSKSISPLSGWMRPIIHLTKTDFPAPLRPMTRLVFPSSKVASMPLMTSLSAKAL